MSGYIFRRIVLVAFIAMSLLFAWSIFGPTEYHYTKYHDVHILSEKKETVHNECCDSKDHDHYMITKYIVEWKGTNSKGETKKFTTKFDDENDSYEGISYKDLRNGFSKEHNCTKSKLTWMGFIVLLILFLFIYCTEDLDDYYSSEKKDINELRICIWAILSSFCGYNDEVITKVANYYANTNLYNKIIRYSELYNKYNEEYKKFSTLDIKSSKNNQDEI